VIRTLTTWVHWIRPEFQESGSWYLQHNNAPAHSSGTASKFWVKRRIPIIPFTFPALALVDSFLLPKLKDAMKLMWFEAVSSIQKTVTWELKAKWEKVFFLAIHCTSAVNVVPKQVGTMSDDINKYFYLFCVALWPQFRNLIVTLCICVASVSQWFLLYHYRTKHSITFPFLLTPPSTAAKLFWCNIRYSNTPKLNNINLHCYYVIFLSLIINITKYPILCI
jgi:hypothetical protein